MKFCAICGSRPATCRTDFDNRNVPACAACLEPVPEPEQPYVIHDMMTHRILRAASRLDQFTMTDLSVALDVGRHDAEDVRRLVSAQVHAGAIRMVNARIKTAAVYELTDLGRRRVA